MREINFKRPMPNYFMEMFRSTGSGMLWLMILLVLGGLYLAVSSKTAQVGREVIRLTDDVRQQQFFLNELEAKHAEITAPEMLRARARSLGYRDATVDDVVYHTLDELEQKSDFVAPAPDTLLKEHNNLLSPVYTETLIDAIRRWFDVGVQE
jgi:hypothetical protein